MINELDPLLIVVAAFVGGFFLVSFLWKFLPGASKPEKDSKPAPRADFSEVAGEFETWSSGEEPPRERTEGDHADILGLDGRITPSILSARVRELAARHPAGSAERRRIDEANLYFRRRFGI